MVMHFHVQLHHLVHIERLHASRDRHPHRVADEIHRVMILHELGILRENRALVRPFNVRLDGHQAFFPRLGKQIEHHLQRFQIPLLGKGRSAQNTGQTRSKSF
jgi:hypothetical protein